LPRHSEDPTDLQTQFEFELGLPHRLQLDLYLVANREGDENEEGQRPFVLDEQKVELRWALGKWGAIPGNPTLYAEWVGLSNEPDHFEGKLLFGGQLGPGWHWGSNLVWEHELGGVQENSNELTAGVSKTLKDQELSVGGEFKLALVD